MPMHAKGLTKLIEECGELTQIAAKKSAYMHTDQHPDGNGSMKARLEHELGDVMAACLFVGKKFDLDWSRIVMRREEKLKTFHGWDANPES